MKNKTQISLGLSLRTVPYLDTLFSSALIYTDKDNNHPPVGHLISTMDIVFSKEELTDDKWFILSPSPPNPNFQEELRDLFYRWRRQKLITIWAEEFVKEIINKERSRKREAETENQKIENKRRLRSGDFKFDNINQDPLKLPPECIKAKYNSIEEFKANIPRYESYESDFELKITKQYRRGDEIWFYSNFDDYYIGWQIETFILIRNRKIRCSPIIRSRSVCFTIARPQ